MVCERWCVKDGGWQRWLRKMVCGRLCVRDGVWKMVCDKVVWNKGVWQSCVVCDRWKMVVDKVVWDKGGRRRRRRRRRRPGIANQKQEPHTKLRGKKTITFGAELWKENGVPKLRSFWLHFTLKECNLKFTKGFPPQVAKFNAIIALTNEWCSSIFYVWVSATDSWWQPKQTSKEKEKQG